MQQGQPGNGFGRYLEGQLDARDVPRKVVCQKTGIHPSTLSRKINGIEQFQHEEILSIGIAMGSHVAGQPSAKTGR